MADAWGGRTRDQDYGEVTSREPGTCEPGTFREVDGLGSRGCKPGQVGDFRRGEPGAGVQGLWVPYLPLLCPMATRSAGLQMTRVSMVNDPQCFSIKPD